MFKTFFCIFYFLILIKNSVLCFKRFSRVTCAFAARLRLRRSERFGDTRTESLASPKAEASGEGASLVQAWFWVS